MTEHIKTANAGDHRRAMVAFSHYLHRDFEGLTAVLKETGETGRHLEAFIALMHAVEQFVPEFKTDLGQQILRQQILFAATSEGETNDH